MPSRKTRDIVSLAHSDRTILREIAAPIPTLLSGFHHNIQGGKVRRQAFRSFLVARYRGSQSDLPLSATSAGNCVSYAANAERALGTDLDELGLGEQGLVTTLNRLRASGGKTATLSGKMISHCSSALRAYAQFVSGGQDIADTGGNASLAVTGIVAKPRSERPSAVQAPSDPLVSHTSVKGLLAMHGAIMDELRSRGIVRTSNAPSGDYAETLFARAFGWTLANSSALGYDAIDTEGARYQIKSRRVTRHNGSRQLSAIRRLPEKAFDYLAAVLFDESYGVSRAIILPHHAVESRARFRAHTNSWLFMLDDRVWDLEEARDTTVELSKAAEGL